MTDVILVNTKVGNEAYAYAHPPLGLMYIAAVLEQNGYSAAIIDMRVEDDWQGTMGKLLSQDPICVGISSKTGTQIASGLVASEFVRSKNPNLPIIWGGIHPTLFPEQTLADSRIDIVVRGEGEQTMLELVQAIEKKTGFDKIAGISYKENGKVKSNGERPFLDMNKLPLPAWHLLDAEKYAKPYPYLEAKRSLPVHTSRGCPWRCTFCYNLFVNKRHWRSKTAENVIEEIKFMVDRFKLDGIIMREDNFVTDHSRAIAVSQGMRKEGIDVTWYCNMRATDFKDELMQEMVKGGLSIASVGAESGSQKILDFIQKDLKVEQLMESARKAKQYNITPVYSFIIGLPTEEQSDINLTIRAIKELRDINPNSQIINMNIFTPYPGGDLYEISKKHGFVEPKTLEEWGRYNWNTLNIPWVKNSELINVINSIGVFALNERAVEAVRKKGLIFNVAGWVLQKSAKFRWENEFWSMPIEFKALKVFSKLVEKQAS